ncbi:diaminopimelate decarboxylase [bacterium]|nr:diaminopimelate decarboxylase [bacterium]
MTGDFVYRGGELFAENVPVAKIARSVGTPFYAYSRASLEGAYRAWEAGFSGTPHIIAYSVKANSSLGVVAALARLGAGADVVSGGELYRARRAGIPANRIVFSGVGKTEDEMRDALAEGILMFNVESMEELAALSRVAKSLGVTAPVALRVNPDVDPKTHKYISTGLKTSKFGIDINLAREGYDEIARLPNLAAAGIACHIGSQLTDLSPVDEALGRVTAAVKDLRGRGHTLRYLDVGGGLGITYRAEEPPPPGEHARLVRDRAAALGMTLIVEPGRSIAGNAGILVTSVLYRKEQHGKRFVVVDAGMNDLIRPSLYDSWHELWPVRETPGEMTPADVVGPICETGDFLAKDRPMPPMEPAGLIAVMSAGAYGFVMSGNYNTRPRPAEVLVDGDRFHVIRRRERLEDLVAGETIPD